MLCCVFLWEFDKGLTTKSVIDSTLILMMVGIKKRRDKTVMTKTDYLDG